MPTEAPHVWPVEPINGKTLASPVVQTPPPSEFDNVVVSPRHIVDGPTIVPGVGFTVTISVMNEVGHIVDDIVQVIIEVPAETPVIMPEVDPAVAMPGELLTQLIVLQAVLPAPTTVQVSASPVQSNESPSNISGVPITVITIEVIQPVVELVNDITEVPPDTPVTIPVLEPIVATPVLTLVQIPPPEVVFVRVTVAPSHTAKLVAGSAIPIGSGIGNTVTTVVLTHPVDAV